ncbi:hypothetical protein ACFX12_032364 [Malus domestica]
MGKPSKGKKSKNLGKGMAPKSLLSVMNTYNAGGSPAVSTPSVVAPKPMLMATSSHSSNGSAAGYVNQQTTLPLFFRQYERALEN